MRYATPVGDAPVTDYESFLRAKVAIASTTGLDVSEADVHPALMPHQRAVVPWAIRGGRRAVFASFGLGKTLIQLETLRLLLARVGGAGLITLPLGVRQEFMRDARIIGVSPKFIRSPAEIEPGRIHLTNYETVRDGKLDPNLFTVASLDEASALRGFGGTKTFREFMRLFAGVRYRFVATATPSPNEYIELLSYAAFLGIMEVSEAKTRFFRRDSTRADKLTIHPHKEREFWLWVASWALFIHRPSDLGAEYSDDGYVLPDLDVRWHEVPSDHSTAGVDRDGQGKMFRDSAIGVVDAAREKRDSLIERVERMVAIVRSEGVHAGVVSSQQGEGEGPGSGQLPKEQRAEHSEVKSLGSCEPRASQAVAAELQRPEPREAQESCSGSLPNQPEVERAGPRGDAEEVSPDPGRVPGSPRQPTRRVRDLRKELPGGEDGRGSLARDGEGEGNPLPEVQHRPGVVLRRPGDAAGSGGLSDQIVIWCDLNDEQRAIERALDAEGISYVSLYGSQDVEYREELIEVWRRRGATAFLSKPRMYGAGVNLQQCHTMIFAGITFKAQDVIQAVHRIHRFLQEHPCRVHFIYTDAEREIRRALEAKWERHRQQTAVMSEIIREHGLAAESIHRALQRSIGVERHEDRGKRFLAVCNDSVLETRTMATDSVHLVLTSIPFGTQYEYSASYHDFGHTDDNDHFWAQMDYLTPEILRVLQPGRVCAIHVKDRIVPGGMLGLGFQTAAPFHAEAITHYMRHGFAYLGMKTIVTDVVRENNQTYRLGWTEQCKDGSRMGVGMPEYLLIFRKPPTDRSNGYADVPVVKAKPLCDDHGEAAPFDKRRNWKRPVPGTGYSRARWQMDAHGFSRSSGDRLLSTEELATLPHDALYKLWRERSLGRVYDFEEHVAVAEELDHMERLPATFMLFPPHSWHPDVWSDVARMRTLNGAQQAAGREMHLCPMQLDIADRAIAQYTTKGETVYDPFGGIGTVAYRSVLLGRRGITVELSPQYHGDAVTYLRAAEDEVSAPTLFDLDAIEAPETAEVAT